jgi:hypothetical protein
MIASIGSHALTVPPVTALRRRQPSPDEVQGVVVNPPRNSRVAVRVEVVTRGEPQEQPRTAEREPDPKPYSYEGWLFAANLEASKPAQELGAPSPRRAAAAYSAQADWQQQASQSAPEAPQYLDVRA